VNEQRVLPSSCDSADSRRPSETRELVQRCAETIHIRSADDSKGHPREARTEGSGANSNNSTPYGGGKEARVASFPSFLHIEGYNSLSQSALKSYLHQSQTMRVRPV